MATDDQETWLINTLYRLLIFPSHIYEDHAKLSGHDCLTICHMAFGHLQSTKVCLQVESPINIVGDIHGQFHDLLRIFNGLGEPPTARYIFLGNYINIGKYSLEVIALLFGLMVLYPESVFLLRGNHEAANVCGQYGFKKEVMQRYGEAMGIKVLKSFMLCFQWLPLAAIINRKIFCCHGGVSPSFELEPYSKGQAESVNQLNKDVERPFEPPEFGVTCDLLWADPMPSTEFAPNDPPSESRTHWLPNTRGRSFLFSCEALEAVLKRFDVQLLIRGHQVAQEGYMFHLNKRCMTVFSAPGYSGTHKNAGAVLQIKKKPSKFDVRKPGPFFVMQPVDNLPLDRLFWPPDTFQIPDGKQAN